MCQGIALPIGELPEELLWTQRRRIILREPGVSREVRFLYRDPQPELPVWHDCRLRIYRWGNYTNLPTAKGTAKGDSPIFADHASMVPEKSGQSPKLPRMPWCRQEGLEAGYWRHLHPVPVEIPAALGLEKGVWFLVPEGGLRGVLVRDEHGRPHVYLLTQPASHYYQIMTRSSRMPVFLGRQM